MSTEVAVNLPLENGSYNPRPPHSPTISTAKDHNQVSNNHNEAPRRGRRTPGQWFKKYFWEGQTLNKTQNKALEELDPNAPWHKKLMVKYRLFVGIGIASGLCHIVWWTCAIKYNWFALFPDRYYMTLTMILGGCVAGMTSEGGGAVAFPVLTLAFNVSPSVARDVALMVQSCGMSAATFVIFWMRVQVEMHSIVFCFGGGVLGVILGLEFVDPYVSAKVKKMIFVCVWFAFAFALFLLNRYHKRKTYRTIPDVKPWKIIVLLCCGFVGGVFTAVVGGGVDICSFSVLTLLFRVSEKTATPTSVVMMAWTSLVGLFWRRVIQESVTLQAWNYIIVTAPVVMFMAPFGSILGTHFHRQVLAALIYILDTISLVTAFVILPLGPDLIGMSVGILIFGFAFFGAIAYLGQRMMNDIERRNADLGHVDEDGQKEIKGTANGGFSNKAYQVESSAL